MRLHPRAAELYRIIKDMRTKQELDLAISLGLIPYHCYQTKDYAAIYESARGYMLADASNEGISIRVGAQKLARIGDVHEAPPTSQ